MADTHATGQTAHMTGTEHILYQAVIFAKIEFTVITRGNTGGILSAVLKHRKRIIKRNSHIGPGNNANYTTHAKILRIRTSESDFSTIIGEKQTGSLNQIFKPGDGQRGLPPAFLGIKTCREIDNDCNNNHAPEYPESSAQ